MSPRGGKREGSGRRKRISATVRITLPPEDLARLDAMPGRSRSAKVRGLLEPHTDGVLVMDCTGSSRYTGWLTYRLHHEGRLFDVHIRAEDVQHVSIVTVAEPPPPPTEPLPTR